MSAKRRGSSRASSLDQLFDVATEAMEVTRATTPAGAPASEMPKLSIRAIRPDPLQARRILPAAVRTGFVTGQLDPPGALVAWQAMAEENQEEAELLQSEIISLAVSIRQQELVNPITVFSDGRGEYIIETGERRWWAHWWLVSVEELDVFELIRAQIVPAASPERQAAENLQDSQLSAVQEACQIARLLLHLTRRDTDHVVAILDGENDPEVFIGYDLYRNALEMERGDVYGKWPVISQIMGRGERQLLRQLALLKLEDDALVLCDRHRLTEGQLRPLVSVAADTDQDRQCRIVSLAARYDLPGTEVAKLVKATDLDKAEARIRKQAGLDKEEKKPSAIRNPSSIMIDRLRSVRRLAVRHEKGGLRMNDLVNEIASDDQAAEIHQELADLTDMLIMLRDQLAEQLGVR